MTLKLSAEITHSSDIPILSYGVSFTAMGLTSLCKAVYNRVMNKVTKNQETGTMIEIGHQDTFGVDNDQYVWLTYCIDHASFIGHETKRRAIQWAVQPSTWCEGCAELIS